MYKNIFLSFFSLFLIFSLIGCSDSTAPDTTGTISLAAKYQTTTLAKTAAFAGIDSIRITKVVYLLKEIKFKTQTDSSDGLYKTNPLILDLNLTGSVQNLDGLTVPFGTYNRLEFDIHKAEAADTVAMTSDQKVKIRPFFSGTDKYSIIIEGKTYSGGVATDFVYKSALNVKQKIDLASSLVVSEGNPTCNVTMLINSFGWFQSNSSFLDPSLAENRTKIDNNIRQSIHAIKDNNKDGIAE